MIKRVLSSILAIGLILSNAVNGDIVLNGYVNAKTDETTNQEVIAEETQPIDISSYKAVLSKTSYTYNGNSFTPKVKVSDDNKSLSENTDYTVSYSNNTAAGTAKVTIKGIGDYTGTIVSEFKISKASISKTKIAKIADKTFTGKAIKPKISVKFSDNNLKKGTDFTATYKNNKSVGTATVTIKGTGNFNGKITKTFKIVPKKTSIKSLKSPEVKKMKATWKKIKSASGYQLTFATNKTFTKNVKNRYIKGTSKTIGNLKKGKTYYVKVRTYKSVKGKRYYGKYSKVKKITIKDDTVSTNNNGQEYILNTDSHIYHTHECVAARKMSSENKSVVKTTVKELEKQGYRYCGICANGR